MGTEDKEASQRNGSNVLAEVEMGAERYCDGMVVCKKMRGKECEGTKKEVRSTVGREQVRRGWRGEVMESIWGDAEGAVREV